MRTCLLNSHSRVNDALFRLTLPNHAEYADRHGYDLICLHRTYEETCAKLDEMILELSPTYDRILTIGSDVIFTNPDVPLDAFDDGIHSVFIQVEGIGYPCLNFDLVLWTKADGVRHVIQRLRDTREIWESHPYGMQTGITLLSQDAAMAPFIKVYPPRFMQSAPFPDYSASWEPGDFSLHCLGMSNEQKYKRCRHFLETGQVLWSKRNIDV